MPIELTPTSGPASGTLTISYTELGSEIGDYLGVGRSSLSWSDTEEARIDSIIQSGLRQVYYPQNFKPEIVHQWSWMRPEATITTVADQADYTLPEGFDGSFDGDLHYQTSDNAMWPSIKFVSPEMIRKKRQHTDDTDRPQFAAIQPVTFDATVGQRWELTLFPTPSAIWTLYGRYKVRPVMIDGTNLYPLGGSAMAEVFLESCLAVAEKRWVEDSKIHQEEFQRLLMQAISHDADVFSADNLGYNSDCSEVAGHDILGRRFDNAIHSYEGVTYYD